MRASCGEYLAFHGWRWLVDVDMNRRGAVGSGTQPVASGVLGSWTVSGLADGPYTLKLEVKDLAAHVAESRSSIVLDSRAPDAEIESPAADAYLNAAAAVTGRAIDANLDSWRLEAAPGEASTAFQWSLVGVSSAPEDGGTLAEWAPLPPDGRGRAPAPPG